MFTFQVRFHYCIKADLAVWQDLPMWQPAVYSPEVCQVILSGDNMCGMSILDTFVSFPFFRLSWKGACILATLDPAPQYGSQVVTKHWPTWKGILTLAFSRCVPVPLTFLLPWDYTFFVN